MSSFKPLGSNVLVRLPDPIDKKNNKTAGGIYLPEKSKPGVPMQGIVVALGDGQVDTKTGRRRPPRFAVGDSVVFAQYTGHNMEVDGHECLLIPEDQIAGTLEELGEDE